MGWSCLKWLKGLKIAEESLIWLEMAGNGGKFLKMNGNDKKKWLEMAENCDDNDDDIVIDDKDNDDDKE